MFDPLWLVVLSDDKIALRQIGDYVSAFVPYLNITDGQVGLNSNYIDVGGLARLGATILNPDLFLIVPFQSVEARAKVLELWPFVRERLRNRGAERKQYYR